MAKSQNDLIYDDGSLAYLRQRVTRLTVCSSQPASYAQANSTTGVMLAKSNVLTSTDFTLADGDVNGRKVTLAAQNGITVSKSGTMTHGAWIGSTGSVLYATTTITSAALTSGHGVNVPAHDFEIGDLAFSPTDISGLVGWWDFSDISTLYQDSSKTTPVASDGDPIGAVEDKGSNGYDATQATSTNKPTYKTGVQNSLSAALFDATNDYLVAAAVSAFYSGVDKAATLVVAGNIASVAASQQREFLSFSNTGDSNPLLEFEWETFGTPTYRTVKREDGGGSTKVADGGTPAVEAIIYEVVIPGTTATMYVDGTKIADAEDLDVGATTLNTFTVGALNFGGTYQNFHNGHIFEALVYDSALSDTDLGSVRSYLNDKWATY